ncbi:Rnl2 family RNA ligase [Streptosporangium becharense]|uniref:Rnl2 family RNA ligase n=1 Tax=Streptosporangium becharense TaxID=1816182 RepID=A0A7W9MJ40_9ACTN|nr:RNA ligase family protein [Streptosporangium becharense]MBB2911512.1 Rnl2 family RNA ligase [Streptosporangium becharense]MBB5822670.1 Rnl2 family RNA ligase [Streptosporangium becharense]
MPEWYPKISQRWSDGPARAGMWVAEEKVHGAHLALVTDGVRTRAARRRGILDESELDVFFGVARIWPLLATAASTVARRVGHSLGGVREVVLYGELAGGHYPHPEVTAEDGAQPVQTGIWYSPGLVWLAFDALVHTAAGQTWLGRADLEEHLAGTGLRCVPLLRRGRRAEVQETPVEFPTEVPALLGLPPLPGNLAEGYVVKPAGRWPVEEHGPRPVLKVKLPAFAEDSRYDGARPFVPPADGAAGVPGWLLAAAVDRLTPPRAASARSKLGPGAGPDVLAAEVLADLLADLSEDLGGLADDERRRLGDALAPGVRLLVSDPPAV